MVFGNVTIEGNDSTQNMLSMYRSLKRNDINCIMLDGLIISMYDIIDGEELRENTNVPVIAITFKDSEGLEGTIQHHFSNDSKLKLELYRKLGQRDKTLLNTGKVLFVRSWGIISKEASMLVAERFILSLTNRYGKHPVSTDGDRWYPQACKFLNIDHHIHSSLEKSLMERTMQYIKDKTEGFDDYFPCK